MVPVNGVLTSGCHSLSGVLFLLTITSSISFVASQPAYCSRSVTATGSNPTAFRPNPSRVYPFCIGTDPASGGWNALFLTSGFSKVIDDINNARNKNQAPTYAGFKYSVDDHLLNDPTNPSLFPQAMHVHRLIHAYEGPGSSLGTFMNNWIVLEFYNLFYDRKGNKRKIQGIYIQGIQGPLGIPFGEFFEQPFTFTTNGSPFVGPQDPEPPNFLSFPRYIPCKYYSKAGPTIPNVFMWSNKVPGPGYNVDVTGKFHALVRWDDPHCAEVAFMQFLVVVVYDWGSRGSPPSYRVGLSPIVLPGEFLNEKSGLAYPYYPDYGALEILAFRGIPAIDSVRWDNKTDNRLERIVANMDYEHCVQHKVGLVSSGPHKGACPPGPFKCAKTFGKMPNDASKLRKWKNDLWKTWSNIYKKYDPARSACAMAPITSPTPPPSTTSGTTVATTTTSGTTVATTTTSGSRTTDTTTEEPEPPTTTTTKRPLLPVEKHDLATAGVAKKVERKKVISHGDLCVFIWLVLVPVSNYFARFFKDFPNFGSIGIGFWIVSHVFIHHIAAMLMWISFGLVASNGVSFLGGAGLLHYIFGFPATLIQHYELFAGFIRNQRLQVAMRQSAVHVINGYVSGLLSSCAGYSRIQTRKWYVAIALFVLNSGAILIGNLIEWRISKRLGMYPSRKYFPALERVMMVNTKPRHYKLKIFTTFLYLVLMFGLYSLYFLYK